MEEDDVGKKGSDGRKRGSGGRKRVLVEGERQPNEKNSSQANDINLTPAPRCPERGTTRTI